MPAELRALFERYCVLGRLLPAEADIAIVVDDSRALAEARIVLREMEQVKKQIDAFLAAARPRDTAG
jgi:hypothetical protein